MSHKITKEAIEQNLKDAGCDCDTITCFMNCDESGNKSDQKTLLSRHRKKLLDKVHEGQKCIDCLDYLVYQIEKEDEEKNK